MSIVQNRKEKTLKIKLSEILSHYTDNFTGIVSLSKVNLTKNLERADIFISVIGGDSKKVEQKLHSMRYILKRKLAQKLSFRKIPELVFRYDDSGKRAFKVNQKLNELSSDFSAENENL